MKMFRNSYFYLAASMFVYLIHGLPQMKFRAKLSFNLNRNAIHTNSLVSVNKLIDFTSCVDECSRYTNCLAINYRARAKLCEMRFYKGRKRDVLYDDETDPLFVIWHKDMEPRVSSSMGDKETTTLAYCDIPKSVADRPIYGNMFTSGSKQAYGCYDHSRQTEYRHVMVCRDDNWSNMVDVCGFEKTRTFRGKRYSYKYVSERVTKKIAFGGCMKDQAGLIKIPTEDKRDFLLANYAADKVDWWVDAQLNAIMDWTTSDGEEIHDHIFLNGIDWFFNAFRSDECATTEEDWQLQPTACSEHRPYICELVL